jgi:hypothetical protein
LRQSVALLKEALLKGLIKAWDQSVLQSVASMRWVKALPQSVAQSVTSKRNVKV